MNHNLQPYMKEKTKQLFVVVDFFFFFLVHRMGKSSIDLIRNTFNLVIKNVF